MPEENEFVERPARLFRAGHYPKKNLTVTVKDLQRIAAGTTEAPIQVGHVEEKFRLGTAHGFEVRGDELWGTLRLHRPANALLALNGNLDTLSIGVPRTLDRLKEVSVTGNPHVAGAQMFSDDNDSDTAVLTFSIGEETINPMPEEKKTGSDAPTVSVVEFNELKAGLDAAKATIEQLMAANQDKENSIRTVQMALRRREAEARVATFSDRIPSAAREKAITLLMTDETVNFSGTEKPAAVLFSEFLNDLPPYFKAPIKGSAVFSDPESEPNEIEIEMGKKMGYDLDKIKQIKAAARK